MNEVVLAHLTATSCLGAGLAATAAALAAERTGLAPCEFDTAVLDTCVGRVAGVEDQRLPAGLERFDCRNNRLAELALRQDGFETAVAERVARFGRRRIGLLLGTSTSGVLSTEIAYRHRDSASGALPGGFCYQGTHNCYSVGDFVRRRLGLEGPAAVISTACSSGAKVFAAARRLLTADLVDAVVVGGVDSLCLTTLYGFQSLQLTARGPCRPFDAARDGISLGEAAAFVLLERPGDDVDPAAVVLLGVGESCDAWHLSAPHPEGRGAILAMQAALADAGLEPKAIEYINLHGTGTPSNDLAESRAVAAVFGTAVPCSSTKGATGHALGAAGALEAVVCALALEHGLLPAGLNVETPDPALGLNYLRHTALRPVSRVLSNSFGFGGTNCSLILGQPGRGGPA
jgi:3-oxoacyl-[acyl-carrier-protein] synthase-1